MADVQTNPQSVDQINSEPLYSIDGQSLKHAFFAALIWLRNHQQVINSLNVFPVPDGDTGTNMFLTMQSAYSEISESEETNIGKITHMFSQGALMGARGNSGVILSQLLRGFARLLDDQPTLDADKLVQALGESRNTAYKGVVRPVEGTILTVAKDMAKAAEDARVESNDILLILEKTLKAGEESLKNTPNLLPILKQAGVVDSGGKGLVIIKEGIYRYSTHQPIETGEVTVERSPISLDSMQLSQLHEEIEPGQDFEIVVDFKPNGELNLDSFYDDLSKLGTSIQVGEGDDMYRMHIHVPTEKKYDPIELVGKYGIVQKAYIENLQEQMKAELKEEDFSNPVEEGQIAVIAVSPGNGISRIFKSLGVSEVVSGGQTMNPSTNDIFQAYKDLPTDKIIILPNNKNIIMAAEASKKLSDKTCRDHPNQECSTGIVRLPANGPGR
jgi:DAK2 domain fusion protein YloV